MFAKRLLTAALLSTTLVALAGCKPGSIDDLMGAEAPISATLTKLMKEKNMGVRSPMMVRLFKEESELEVWKQTDDGTYALLTTYPICAWSGKLGPKTREGDRQAPEGFYNITRGSLNPRSQHHLAFDIGYPNRYDASNGFTGQHLMVHGSCNSSGCYAMDNQQIEQIYALAREAFAGGQRNFQFQAYPFRMTAKNMARHNQSQHYAFWSMLKQGYDAFEATKRPVKVDVCERRYLFNAQLGEGVTLDPAGTCPTVQEDPAMAARRVSEEAEIAALVARMDPSEFVTQSTFTYRTGDPITAEAYAREQNRRAGYDRLGNRIDTPARTSIFGALISR
jgi:murein L,D-transpeptidase YafK